MVPKVTGNYLSLDIQGMGAWKFIVNSSFFITLTKEKIMNGSCPCLQNQPPQFSSGVQSWNDLSVLQPKDPTDLIAWANITGATTAFALSSTFLESSWVASPFSIGASLPKCAALGTDSLQNVADADQWNFQHLTAKIGDGTIAPPLLKVIFLRAGTQWKNTIQFHYQNTPKPWGNTRLVRKMMLFR
jgi:hypothetical protein